MIYLRTLLAIGLLTIIPACQVAARQAAAPSPAANRPDANMLIRHERLGTFLDYVTSRDPDAAPWFMELSDYKRNRILTYLNQCTVNFREPLKPKIAAIPAWTFASPDPPTITLESNALADPPVKVAIVRTEIFPTLFSARRHCELLITWNVAPETLSRAGIPLASGTFYFLADFSYYASPLEPGTGAPSPPATPEAQAPLAVSSQPNLDGVLSLQPRPDGSITLDPAPKITLFTHDSTKEGPVTLTPGERVWPVNIGLLGAGGLEYTYLGQSSRGYRFLEVSSFYDIIATTYRYIDVPAYPAIQTK